MKKVLALLLALTLVLSLAACAKKDDAAPADDTATEEPAEVPAEEPAEAPAEEPAEAPAEEPAADDEAAAAAADKEMFDAFMNDVINHQANMAAHGALTEKLAAGEVTAEEVLASMEALATESSLIAVAVQANEWKSQEYAERVAALTATTNALGEAEIAAFEASKSNDAAAMENVKALYATYDENLGILLDLIGA